MHETYSNITSGRAFVTTAATRVRLPDVPCRRVDITAETDNTGVVVVGDAAVVAALATRNGIPLAAGVTYTFYVQNLQQLYIDSMVSTDGVTYNIYS